MERTRSLGLPSLQHDGWVFALHVFWVPDGRSHRVCVVTPERPRGCEGGAESVGERRERGKSMPCMVSEPKTDHGKVVQQE